MSQIKWILPWCLCIAFSTTAEAAYQQHILVDVAGKRITDTASTPQNARILPVQLNNKCSQSVKACFRWRLINSDASAEVNLKTQVDAAFALWTSITTLNVAFESVSTAQESAAQFQLPYKTNSSGRIKDAYDNYILEGDFFVAFPKDASEVPSEVTFADGVFATTILYIVPNLSSNKSSIEWAGIYLNPRYRAGTDYKIPNVVAGEIGKVLGLSSSGIRNSIMYPLRDRKAEVTALASDDALFASSLYSQANFDASVGSITGRVIDGATNQGWIGAQIALIPSAQVVEYTHSPTPKLLQTLSAVSQVDGSFSIPAIPKGDYVVALEPLNFQPFSYAMFDDYIQAFGTLNSFVSEFYDGKDRESNQEAILTSSPAAILYAATVHVDAGHETSSVEIITNQGDPKIAVIKAAGSSNETLSSKVPPKMVSQVAKPDVPADGDGGCSLQPARSLDANLTHSLGMILMAVLILCAILRRLALRPRVQGQPDRRARWFRSVYR